MIYKRLNLCSPKWKKLIYTILYLSSNNVKPLLGT